MVASLRKKLKLVMLFLLLIELCSIFLMYKSFSNKDSLEKTSINNEINGQIFALMIEQDNGTYKESKDNTWPNVGYSFNETKSACVDKNGNALVGVLEYENSSNTVYLKTIKTAYCYLYFDKRIDIEINVSTDDSSGIVPSNLGYTKSITCTNGTTPTWNYMYNRIEISSVVSGESKCNLSYTKDNSTHTTLKSEVEVNASTNANGYRYSGTNPDNYVWFNDEMWRIIGSIPTCTSSGCATSENLIKIIRKDSIGGLAYDAKPSGYTGEWGANTLYSLLNNYYWGAKNGTETDYCYSVNSSVSSVKAKCDYTILGINESSYYGKMIENVYWNTGLSNYSVTAGDAYANEVNTQTVSGHVGLMAASDFGYAAASGYHSVKMYNYNTSSISKSNWLYGIGNEYVSTSSTDATPRPLYVSEQGFLFIGSSPFGYSIRPVVYLDSDVYVVSGIGTEANPYVIAMN